jgi:hypothetical protein
LKRFARNTKPLVCRDLRMLVKRSILWPHLSGKGVGEFIRNITPYLPDAHFYIAGPLTRPEYLTIIEEATNAVKAKVKNLGTLPRDELAKYHASADVCVNPLKF